MAGGLATSGSLSILATAGTSRRIALEVDGNETPNKVLTTLASTASRAANILAFYGYSSVSPPNAPSNAVATYTNKMVVTWNDNSTDEDNFIMNIKQNLGAYGSDISFSANTTATLTPVIEGVTYQYRIKAVNAAGSSGFTYSNSVYVPLESCLLKNSKILIDENFNTKNIQDLKVGDAVYSLHEKTGVFGLYNVTKCETSTINRWIYIKTLAGREIKCSESHLVLVKSKQHKVSDLKSSDKLMYIKDSTNKIFEDTIVEFKIINEAVEVYKVEVGDGHTYITANGLIHHNIKIE